MKDTRHPHPHLDPRQPRHQSRPGTNPPVFSWKPPPATDDFRLLVSRASDLSQPVLDIAGLPDPLFLPEAALAPGTYYWRWSAGTVHGEVFSFEISDDAVRLEVPAAAQWLAALPKSHPRLFVDPASGCPPAVAAAPLADLCAEADQLLTEAHHFDEPPYLTDRQRDHRAFFAVWYPTMWGSRRFVKGAETLALAHLLSGRTDYARAACQRLASISQWAPDGSTHIDHNDEAHMSVIWHGAIACDWVWAHFTAAQRQRVIAQFRRRGQTTYAAIHDSGTYGITRFDSHAGREIVFLAHIALVFHDHIPEAQKWLDWLRPVLCGIWPIWADDDGAWDAGPSYGLAYINIMTMFASALKRATGVDLYRRPFWRHHGHWRRCFVPPYAEWIGFGDHSQRWASGWKNTADLVELIARETGDADLASYATAMRGQTDFQPEPTARRLPGVNSQLFLCPQPPAPAKDAADEAERVLQVFADAGWAAFRTDLNDPQRDLALFTRSSPYGSISHAHANNNDLIIHVAGRVMAMPSGYYGGARLGYGSEHHAHWVWHTKAHNCITLSDAPQLMRSPVSTGCIDRHCEDERLAYLRANADASYADRARRCRRHMFYLKKRACWVLIDEFVAVPGIVSALQWNLHSWAPFSADLPTRSFRLERQGSVLHGHFAYADNAFFSLSEGWDPPPLNAPEEPPWPMQYHLRFTPTGLVERRNLGVVLCPEHAELQAPSVHLERTTDGDLARIGSDRVLIGQGGALNLDGTRRQALALLALDGHMYELSDENLRAL